MHRVPACVLGVAFLCACGDSPIDPDDEAGAGITFAAAGVHAFSARGTHDPGDVLARSFALSFADSLQGLVAMGYSPTGSGVGDILILQFPRQPGTHSCGENLPCHGRLMIGVRQFQHPDGVTGWTVEQHFEIQAGSVVASEVGPTVLRGTFQVTLESIDPAATLEISDGQIDVRYSSSPPSPGESMRGIECLLRLAAGQQAACN